MYTALRHESRKTRRTYYTEDRVRAARENIDSFGWARGVCDDTVTRAEEYRKLGPDTLWKAVTPQSIPRSNRTHHTAGCPFCGPELHKYGVHPWRAEYFEAQWKIKCPSCGALFPSNDFGKYYRSGLDSSGLFDRSLANRSLLVNESYPDKPEGWGVDDGYGWVDEEGKRHFFVAYYNTWGLWALDQGEVNRPGFILSALETFRDAYVYTGDTSYADAGIVLLNRVADVYPAMDISEYPMEAGYYHTHGGNGTGKVLGCISETRLVARLVLCYDAFFDALDDDRCRPALDFLRNRTPDGPETDAAIRNHIENDIIRRIRPLVSLGIIHGNTGMHHMAVALAAVVLDDQDELRVSMDWLTAPIRRRRHPYLRQTGGGLDTVLLNHIDRDGMGIEASPSYNSIWLRELTNVADALEPYPGSETKFVENHPKFRKLFTPFQHVILSGRYVPTIGDSGKAGNPGYGTRDTVRNLLALEGYRRFKDANLARFAHFLNDYDHRGLHYDIFSKDPESVSEEIRRIVENDGVYDPESVNMTGYGLAVLRHGSFTDGSARDVWMYYGRTIFHGHYDSLNLGLHFFGLDLAPDLGNPEVKYSTYPMRFEWTKHTISHNTVTVDASPQQFLFSGIPRQFADTGVFSVADVESPCAYPQTGLYRRGVMAVRIDDERSYIVDVFRVRGGKQHHYSFHGAEGPVTPVEGSGLDLQRQEAGTYAGPDVELGSAYDRETDVISAYKGSGFHYLYNVERDTNPPSGFALEWRIRDTWGALTSPEDIRLRLTMLTQTDEVALADGKPARNKPGNPESLRYMIARRSTHARSHHAGDNLESRFVSLFEPYRDSTSIADVKLLRTSYEEGDGSQEKGQELQKTGGGAPNADFDAAAVRVTLGDGRIDYIINSISPEYTLIVEDPEQGSGSRIRCAGEYAFVRVEKDAVTSLSLIAGALLEFDGEVYIKKPAGRIRGRILDFTRQLSSENEIVLEIDEGEELLDDPEGRLASYVYIENRTGDPLYAEWKDPGEPPMLGQTFQYLRNGSFRFFDFEKIGASRISVDIGDVSTIFGRVDENDPQSACRYLIEKDDMWSIPLIYRLPVGACTLASL